MTSNNDTNVLFSGARQRTAKSYDSCDKLRQISYFPELDNHMDISCDSSCKLRSYDNSSNN